MIDACLTNIAIMLSVVSYSYGWFTRRWEDGGCHYLVLGKLKQVGIGEYRISQKSECPFSNSLVISFDALLLFIVFFSFPIFSSWLLLTVHLALEFARNFIAFFTLSCFGFSCSLPRKLPIPFVPFFASFFIFA